MRHISGTIRVDGNNGTGFGLDVRNTTNGDGINVFVDGRGTVSFGSSRGVEGNSQAGVGVVAGSNTGIGLQATSGTNIIAEFYNQVARAAYISNSGAVNATSFVKSGGTAFEFLKADGTVDSNLYVTFGRTLTINGVTQDLSANRTFNVGTVTGSGTGGIVPRFSTSTSLTNSNIYIATDETIGDMVGIGASPNSSPGYPNRLYVNGTSYFSGSITTNGAISTSQSVTAAFFIRTGGTASQFLKADGSVDSTSYTPTSRTLTINGVSYDLTGNRSWTVGDISGSGAANYVAKFSGTTSLTTGILYDTGSALGVNTTGPLATLHVAGGFIMENQFNRNTVNYTLVATDAGKVIEMNVSSANSVNVPLNSSVPFPIGTEIFIMQYGTGQTSISPVSGVTVRSKANYKKIGSQYTGACLLKVGTDEWYLVGSLVA